MLTVEECKWIDEAVGVAVRAHSGWVSEDGNPFILHTMRVMERMPTTSLRIVAALHDAVDESGSYGVTFEWLKSQGFDWLDDVLLDAVRCMVRGKYESIRRYRKRLASNLLASQVALVDMEEEMRELSRIPWTPRVARLMRESFELYVVAKAAVANAQLP